ncbi:MAG: Fe-S cluster assembly protein SufD [Halioglobus sp.]|nr:Fe-S cluster assembly protein SufD [Halioglobus sp.]
MFEFMQQSLDSAAQRAPAWLQDWLRDGRDRWEASTMPTRKTENWKYTSVQALREHFAPAAAGARLLRESDIDLPQLVGSRQVFINGHHSARLSDSELPDGVSLVRFGEASTAQAAHIRQYLGSAAGEAGTLFTALNDASLAEGVFVEIAAGHRVAQPLHLVWLTTNQGEAFSVNQRLLVLCGSDSSCAVVEQFAGVRDANKAFTNGVSELLLARGATLEHYRLHQEEGSDLHVGGVYARLAEQSTFNSFHLGLGSELKRIDVVVEHCGQGAHSEVNGVYLPRGSEHIDYHTCIEHRVPDCTSSETFRGIIADEARAVFNGRIHIHRDAQKTRAELSNKNLLTSTRAEVNTKPELEIYADDVQCAHGATVAQLNENALHYLRTRGVSRTEAQSMLSFGFINEVIDTVRNAALRDYLRAMLARRFARDPALTRPTA